MTDVSNLDDLAAKISNSHGSIKAYAKAQAAATQAQEFDIQLAKTLPPSSGGGGNGGFWALAQSGQSLQALINSAPTGVAIGIMPGVYNGPLDVSQKNGLRLVGLGHTGWSDTRGRVEIRTTAANQVLVKERSGSDEVKHEGFEIEHVCLRDDFGGGTGIETYNVNHWKVRDVAIVGKFDRAGIWAGQRYDAATLTMYADNAYAYVENVKWYTDGPPMICDFAGLTVVGGTVASGTGFKLLSNTQGCYFLGGKSNHGGTHFYIEGGCNTIHWDCEQYASDSNNVYIIEIVKKGGWPLSGALNDYWGVITDHPYGTGKHVHLGPGSLKNDIDARIISSRQSVSNEGTANQLRLR